MMDDINHKKDPNKVSPSAEFSDSVVSQDSVVSLRDTLSIDDEEAQSYKENFAMIRKLLVGNSDFSIAVSPEGYTIIKIGDIPFIMDDIVLHDQNKTIKTSGHQYYELNRLKENYEQDLPTYEERLKAKETCGSVDSLISIINGAGNGFISRNNTTQTTKTYASGFSFHPFQGEDIYGQYICKRFYNNATKFVPINGENFISCKRVYRGDLQSLSFRPLDDKDILGYMARDGVFDVCYTTQQYVKRLNDQVYEAYLRHKPFQDFYTNLTISSPELKEEFMCNLFLVVLSQYSPHEVHISEVIDYAKTYFNKFNIPTADSDKFFQNIFSNKDTFMEKFFKILGLNNKTFSLLKERISDLQDEYPEYDFKELTLGENLNNHDDYYSKKNTSLPPKKKLLLTGRRMDDGRYPPLAHAKPFPYIFQHFLENNVAVNEISSDKNQTFIPYIQFSRSSARNNTAIISIKELKYLDTRLMQIYAILGVELDMRDYDTEFTIVTNQNELLVDRYSVGKVLLPTDTLPDISYLPTQDDMIQFYDKIITKHSNPWQILIEIIITISDTILADPKNVFDLSKIYVPCRDGWIVISQTDGIKKINDKPDNDPHVFVSLIKNIVPVPKKVATRVDIRDDIKSFRDKRNSIKRYQTGSKKEIKIQQQELLNTLNKRNIQKKDIQYNAQLSEDFANKTQYIKELPFTTASQILANLDIYKADQKKRPKKYIDILVKEGYVETVLKYFDLFDQQDIYNSIEGANVWEKVLPHIKKFTSIDIQQKIMVNSFASMGSKIASFIDYLPNNALNYPPVLREIVKDPAYQDIDRANYHYLYACYLDFSKQNFDKLKKLPIDQSQYEQLDKSFFDSIADISYIKKLNIDNLIKVLPLVNLRDLGYNFFARLTNFTISATHEKYIPIIFDIILDRFSELKDCDELRYKKDVNWGMYGLVNNMKTYYKDDNLLAKRLRSEADITSIKIIIDFVLLENLDQQFLLDFLQLIKGHDPVIKIDEKILDTFKGPLSIAVVDALTQEGYVEMVLDHLDKFVPLPDNYFSNDGAQQFIEKQGVEKFCGIIKYFNGLSTDIAFQINNSDNPEKYKALSENRAAFSSFPDGLLSIDYAQRCLDTYGIDTYSKYATCFDDIPLDGLKVIYQKFYNLEQWDNIVKYLEFFIPFIPSRLYRRLQRHEYIKIVDTNAPDPTQQKQVKKYFAPQEFEALIAATITKDCNIPSKGKYIDLASAISTSQKYNILIDDVIEEYDPFCMPYDYFYHGGCDGVSIGDRKVHVVKRIREDGNSFGFDTIYLVDLTDLNKVYVKKIADSISTQKNISIRNVAVQGESIVIDLSIGEYKEVFQPIVDIRNKIKTTIEKSKEEEFIAKSTPFEKGIITEMFLEEVKKDGNFDSPIAYRFVNLLKKKGGDTDNFLKIICADMDYYKKNPDIIFRAIKTSMSLKIKFTEGQSRNLSDILLRQIDWKKYPKCPINYEDLDKIFSNEGSERKNEMIDKLIKIYSSDFDNFAIGFGDNEKLITRCINTGEIPTGFARLVSDRKHSLGAKYFIESKKETLIQDIITDIKNINIDKDGARDMMEFYKAFIKKNNYEEQVKPSVYLQILNEDSYVIKKFGSGYFSTFLDENGSGNTIQIIHYIHKAGLLEKLQISLIKSDLLKDIVTFSATYDVPSTYLKKLTEEMMQCLRDSSQTYTGDKDLLTSALRFLLTLVPDTFKYFKAYAQSQNYDTSAFINTVYVSSR